MSDKAKRASWLIGLIAAVVGIAAVAGTLADEWSGVKSRVASLEVMRTEDNGRLSRLEIRVDARMARIENKLDRLIERE